MRRSINCDILLVVRQLAWLCVIVNQDWTMFCPAIVLSEYSVVPAIAVSGNWTLDTLSVQPCLSDPILNVGLSMFSLNLLQ